MKPGTMQNTIELKGCELKGCVVLTNFILKTLVKWTERNKRLVHGADNPDRQDRFAAKIHDDNVLKCMRTTGPHLDSKYGCHHDRHNSIY
jgi:hypothetical protein